MYARESGRNGTRKETCKAEKGGHQIPCGRIAPFWGPRSSGHAFSCWRVAGRSIWTPPVLVRKAASRKSSSLFLFLSLLSLPWVVGLRLLRLRADGKGQRYYTIALLPSFNYTRQICNHGGEWFHNLQSSACPLCSRRCPPRRSGYPPPPERHKVGRSRGRKKRGGGGRGRDREASCG